MNQPPFRGNSRNGSTNQPAVPPPTLGLAPVARGPALTRTRQNQVYEKGNVDQRLAAGRVPDRDR